MGLREVCVNLQDCGRLWCLRNVVQHQVHAANGALKAQALAGAGQPLQEADRQETAGGEAE